VKCRGYVACGFESRRGAEHRWQVRIPGESASVLNLVAEPRIR
jgi:hypothetical protein